MEEKGADENLVKLKKEHANLKEVEIAGKCTPMHSMNKELNKKKSSAVELENSKHNVVIVKKEQSTDKQRSDIPSKNRVLKRKLTEDGVSIERVLSEGEASSGFETVSSIDSKLDFEDIQLSSSDSEHNYNVIVRIENDLAYQNNWNSGRRYYWKGKSNNEIRNNSPSKHFFGKYLNPRVEKVKNYKQSRGWQRENDNTHQKNDGIERWAKEDDDYRHSRRRASCDREWSRCSDHSIRSRGSRCSDHGKRSQGSLSNDLGRKCLKKNVTGYTSKSGDSSNRNYRFTGSKTSSFKARQTESRRFRNYDKSRSSLSRNLPYTSQTYSKSASKRLANDSTRERTKNDLSDRSCKSSKSGQIRRKRTPFLVELERKLNEAKNQKSVSNVDIAEKDQNRTPAKGNDAAPLPQAAGHTNSNIDYISSYTSPIAPSNPEIYSVQYPSMPTFSVNNLPLVPGPTGLPVHITMNGEQIPHDMDGRRIPVSPNGYYLPLDPTGRLFAHIVSPGNQAVPIHMTEDGILRLPNSEPVPYGPSHNLPVNIDGSIIPIGPDSKPLCPCPNLPRHPPLYLLQIAQSSTLGDSKTEVQQGTLEIPQISHTTNEQTSGITNPSDPTLQPVQSDLLNFVENSCRKTNKADLLINYRKRAREREENVLKCKEIEKNLGFSPSKGGIKRSIPKKLLQKKTVRDEYSGDCNLILQDSNDSDFASIIKPSSGIQKGCSLLANEVFSNSEETQSVSAAVCDNETYMQSYEEDFIVIKIQQALKSLSEKDFKPPAIGRFIISEVFLDFLFETSPNASPLLKNRVKLPFLMPNAEARYLKDESATVEKTAVIFKFLPIEKSSDKGETAGKLNKTYNKKFNSPKCPVFTFDFSMQCDFTSIIIKNLSMKVSEMEMEVVRLRNINANLMDGFRNIQEANQMKSEELGKALLEIEKRNSEILSLKRLIREKGK